jgi:proteasome accessory factor C
VRILPAQIPLTRIDVIHMPEIPKAERILRLIRLLRDRKRTISQLADLLQTIPRTIYRDIEALKNVGYLIPCDGKHQYSLDENPSSSRAQFSLEETRLIREHLSAVPITHPLKASIERKLYLSSELIPLADELADKHRGTLIGRINAALAEGRQIRLVKYHSNNSSTVADRLVEPISLTDDYATLNAFELTSQKQKTFKLARMEDVEVLRTANAHATDSAELDLFGFSGPEPLPVVVRLTFLAHRLLHEEFPASRGYLTIKYKDEPFPWEFRYLVRDFRGIGRFLLGLPGEVQVVEPEALRVFLREKGERGLAMLDA